MRGSGIFSRLSRQARRVGRLSSPVLLCGAAVASTNYTTGPNNTGNKRTNDALTLHSTLLFDSDQMTPSKGFISQTSDVFNLYHDGPKQINTNLDSKYDDWFNSVDLMFTHDLPNVDVDSTANMRSRMERTVRACQEHVCHEVEVIEARASQKIGETPATFMSDMWVRDKTGAATKKSGGLTKVLSNGRVFEKAGVSVSISSGQLPSRAVRQMTADHGELKEMLASKDLGDENGNVEYFAASVSSVMHPWNPHSPTGHFNYRYFELGDRDAETGEFVGKIWWFGGGGDLTPSIIDRETNVHFHSTLKSICMRHEPSLYRRFKKWCDSYFVIKHRNNERRGVGGLFFDDLIQLSEEGKRKEEAECCHSSKSESDRKNQNRKEEVYSFVRDCAANWALVYVPCVDRHAFQRFSQEHKDWQQLRRGRYTEFNLVYDRGTKFGLMKPGARIESILMSLPLTCRFEYCREATLDFEKELQSVVNSPIDWIPLD